MAETILEQGIRVPSRSREERVALPAGCLSGGFGPAGESAEQLATEFDCHATAWEGAAFLTMAEMFADEDYQRIIEMGPQVVPLILQRLRTHPNWWFPALIELTGVDLTAGQSKGKLLEETRLWLLWAEKQGYLAGKDAG